MPEGDTMLLDLLQTRLDSFLRDLAMLSHIDCGTYDKAGVDAAGRALQEKLEASGLAVERHDGGALGDTLVARRRGRGRARVLLIGHLDTVYPVGWPAAHPFAVEGDTARGPGTADMKAGLLAVLYALDALRAGDFDDYDELAFVLNSDEEIGSPGSKDLIAREARGRDAVLVLEAGRANGDIVSARKGSAHFDLQVTGRAAHAGVEPEKGRSAVLELAHLVVALHALNGTVPGATVNAGVVQGGTRRNVVADRASALIDVRARDEDGLERIIAAIRALTAAPTVPDTVTTLAGAVTHPPMERTAASERLIGWCREAARDAGFDVRDTATGGGSDGNTTAALGVPTLDGLGPVGGDAHNPGEYVLVSSIMPRTAMLAGLIRRICQHAGVA